MALLNESNDGELLISARILLQSMSQCINKANVPRAISSVVLRIAVQTKLIEIHISSSIHPGVYSCFEKGCRIKGHAAIPKGILGSSKFTLP